MSQELIQKKKKLTIIVEDKCLFGNALFQNTAF